VDDAPGRRALSARVGEDALRRVEALLSVGLRLAANARSGRVALAQLATTLDPAWIPSPRGDDFVAQLQDAERAARRPLAFADVERVLRDAWGCEPGEELDELDEQPAAVTPGAQVHRGRLDGTAVAVKVLRPGLAGVVHQDLALLEAVAAPLAAAFPAQDTGAVLAEIRERVLDELDLEHDAMLQRRFHRALRRHPFLSAPAPVTRLCHDEVLVSEWVEGVPFAQAPDPDEAAARLVCFVLGAARWGLAYVDVAGDNVIVTPDGGLAIVDFGACRETDRERTAHAAAALEALARDDAESFTRCMRALDWLPDDHAPAALELVRGLLGEHVEAGASRLDTEAVIAVRDRLAQRAGEVARLLASGSLEPEDLWPARGAGQLLGTIARRGAEGDWVALALQALRNGWD
jgi:predicted unusual protein kinase regulating ubiquinone biosynthesis (AarF/ABC1/UbiB family)